MKGLAMRRARRSLWAASIAVSLAGCASPHMSEDFGRSYAAAFAAQAPIPREPKKAATGLDSQEAAIISGSYRKSLAPKDDERKDAPVLLLAPTGATNPLQALAPSIPSTK
jgi:hypothetical protein